MFSFLVAGDGTVFEGRGWGVMGAHAKDHNSDSLGIAFMGNFNSKHSLFCVYHIQEHVVQGVDIKWWGWACVCNTNVNLYLVTALCIIGKDHKSRVILIQQAHTHTLDIAHYSPYNDKATSCFHCRWDAEWKSSRCGETAAAVWSFRRISTAWVWPVWTQRSGKHRVSRRKALRRTATTEEHVVNLADDLSVFWGEIAPLP